MAEKAGHDIQAERVGKTACHQCGHVMDLSDTEPFTVVACPQCQARFSAPGRLGDFILLKLLGKGEMGATYKAYEKTLGRNVAIKVMRKHLGEDQKRVQDFFAEARAVAALEHPNAVRLYSLGQEKGQPYIVMELIKGRSLDQSFSREEPLDEGRALAIGIGVCRALQAAHRIGLVHGDVKPANIMLDEKAQAKLVDFGIARFGGAGLGQDGILGTPYYVGPEQVRREAADHRTDIYSLGATLFHALTGRPPFPGKTVDEVLQARLDRPAPDLRDLRPLMHPKTAAVVARMLQADPDRRYGDYDELLEALREAYFQVTGLETPEVEGVRGRPEIPTAVLVKPSRGWLIGGLVGGAVLVAACLAAWGLWFRGEDGAQAPPPPTGQQVVTSPLFSPPARSIAGPIDVAITCSTEGAEVRYTTDGGEPTERSPAFVGPVRVLPGMTLRARAYRPGWQPSAVSQAVYVRDTGKLEDAVPARFAAKEAWQRVRGLDPGQGFAERLQTAERLYKTAEELYAQAAYGASIKPYKDLVKLCEELGRLQAARKTAVAAREQAIRAEQDLDRIDGRTGAGSPFGQATASAKAAFERGDFAGAQKHWRSARDRAADEQTRRLGEVRDAWQRAIGQQDASRLAAHAKDAWRPIERSLQEARRAEAGKRPVEAILAYRNALNLLPRVIKAAQAGKVEAEKNELIEAAKELLKKGRLRQALVKVEAALKVKPKSRSAAAAKEAIRRLMTATINMPGNRRLRLAWIPPGKFVMGSPDSEAGRDRDERQHEVVISRPFYLGVHEVTRRQFQAFKQDQRGYKTTAERKGGAYGITGRRGVAGLKWDKPGFEQRDDHPVVCVSRQDAMDFCRWMTRKLGRTVRLPTEAEWEYACRAGTATRFCFGDGDGDLHEHGNYADSSARRFVKGADGRHDDGHAQTAPVGRYKPNAWGLHDMHGNVSEWCYDWRGEYPTGPVTDPRGPERGKLRIIRGGSWGRPAADCRSADRDTMQEDRPAVYIGFRIVVEPKSN